MKNSLKHWFEQQDFDRQDLPKGHELRFMQKLDPVNHRRTINTETSTWYSFKNWSIAATLAILIGAAGYIIGQSSSFPTQNIPQNLVAAQKGFQNTIDVQLEALNQLQSPATERIIADAKKNLSKLENDYLEVQKDFETNRDNAAVIDAMILNFKTRIRLLEDTREQINASNQQLKEQDNELI